MRPIDQLSLDRLQKLHPAIREKAIATYTKVHNALTGKAFCRITYTLRTFNEQRALYNLGRTVVNPVGKTPKKPFGNIVTKAGPGSSFHNYGLALDFALVVDSDGDGKFTETSWDTIKDYDGDLKPDWMEVVAIFKADGWFWGGDFKSFSDKPHFEKTFGKTWRELLALYNAKKFITGTQYVQL